MFLRDPGRESGEKNVIYWLGENFLVEFHVTNLEHGRRHWVGRSREGQEAQDDDSGMGVAVIGLWKGDQLEEEVAVLGYRNGEEGGDWQSGRGALLRLLCYGRVGVLEGREFGEEDLPLRVLKVRLGMESVAPRSEAFRMIFAASLVAKTRVECI